MTRKKEKKEEKRDVFLDPPSATVDKVVSNENLLIEILLRMPAKSLIKFKSVSKSWLRLISDPKFGYDHSHRAANVVTRIYFYSLWVELKSISLEGYTTFPNLSYLCVREHIIDPRLKDICNGLILTTSGSYDTQPRYIVSNLTTQKSTLIPQLRSTSIKDLLFACLAFDPAKSPYYKVIFINQCANSGSYEVDTYSSETKSWQCVEFSGTRGKLSWKKAYWNGAIHWMKHNNIHTEFDVDKGKLIETHLPEYPIILLAEQTSFFGECNGNLLLVQYKSPTVLGFRILEMKLGTRHWVVKNRVNLRPILDTKPGAYRHRFHVLSVVRGSGENDLVLVLASGSVFLSYDLRTQAVKKLGNFEWKRSWIDTIGSGGSILCSWGTHQFYESLFPV